MTTDELMRIAASGVVVRPPHDAGTGCELCDADLGSQVAISSAYGAVHARCAAPVIAEAIRSSGRDVIRHVTGVVCAICRRSFRYQDAVVLVGREGSKSALHVRGCERGR